MGGWQDASDGVVPAGAVVGGKDKSGEPLYVARAQHEIATVPGKLVPSLGCAYIPWGGREYKKLHYQVLVGGPSNWQSASGKNVPPGAFIAGQTETGEHLFVGRVHHDNCITTGKVQQSAGMCYIPFDGKEIGFPDYEVLMI